MAFTQKADFTFKHTAQADEPVFATPATLKTNLDSQAVELRNYINSTLLVELAAQGAAGNIGAVVGGIASTLQAFIGLVEAAGTGTLPPADSVTQSMQHPTVKTGLIASLTTTDKSSLVAAINEIVGNIGSLASLTTTVKNSIVAAINELVTINSYDVGEVKYFAMNTPPTGYLKANGAAVSRTTYAALFAAIGTTYGVGDGSTTFNLPDGRGVVARGWDDGRGYDAGRVFGSYQADDNKAHTHTATTGPESATHTHTVNGSNSVPYSGAGGGSSVILLNGISPNPGIDINTLIYPVTGTESDTHTHSVTTNSTGATETTVKNIAWLCCIRY